LNSKFFRNGIVMLILVIGTVALLYTWLIQSPADTSKSYSFFLTQVSQGQVAKVVQTGTTLTVTTTDTPPQASWTRCRRTRR